MGENTGSCAEPSEEARREPCPTPLSWREVLAAFHSESEDWEVRRGGSVLRGRTWGEGPPLYFLNGFGGTCELYALIAHLLRKEFRCVLYDYPQPSERHPTIRDFTADLFAVAERHADRRFSIYASSFGSLVALQAMRLEPRRVERAMLQNAFAHRRFSIPERLLTFAGKRSNRTLTELPGRETAQQQTHRPWFPPYDSGRWQFFLENTGGVRAAALAARADVARRADLRESLEEITQPVLIVRTEGEGRVTSRSQTELLSGLPNARSEWMHTCGHLPFLTHPHRLAKLVKGFMAEETEVGGTAAELDMVPAAAGGSR